MQECPVQAHVIVCLHSNSEYFGQLELTGRNPPPIVFCSFLLNDFPRFKIDFFIFFEFKIFPKIFRDNSGLYLYNSVFSNIHKEVLRQLYSR